MMFVAQFQMTISVEPMAKVVIDQCGTPAKGGDKFVHPWTSYTGALFSKIDSDEHLENKVCLCVCVQV